MPKFKNREEYDRWKAEKFSTAREEADYRNKPGVFNLSEQESPPKPFIEQLPRIFSYPFRGNGKYMLIAGVLFFWIIGFIPLLGIIIGGYLSAYMMKIIRSSAHGEYELPDWPDFTDFWDDILRPAFLVTGTLVFSFIPVLIYLYFSFKSGYSFSDPLLWPLIVLGALYCPMGFLAVAQLDSAHALNPLIVVPSIIKVPLDYLVASVVLLFVIALSTVAKKILVLPVPLVGSIIANFLSLYFLMIEMRILGLLYYANQERLSWFGEQNLGT